MLRECNKFIEMVTMYVCAGFLRSQKLRVVEIIPLQLGRFPLQTISVNSHISHKHTCPHRRDKRQWMWGRQVLSTNDTVIIIGISTCSRYSRYRKGLKYRLSPRHPSPLLSPLQLESSPLFPTSCSMVFRILDIVLPLSYHATWMAHSRTRFA